MSKQLSVELSLYWDDDTQRLGRRPFHLPPEDAELRQTVTSDDIFAFDLWFMSGAALRPVEEGMRIVTPPGSGQYAATARLALDSVSFDHEACWLSVEVEGTIGDCTVCLYDPRKNRILGEVVLPPGRRSFLTVLRVPDLHADQILFRASGDEPGVTIFKKASLLAAPKPALEGDSALGSAVHQ
jgi:hypothetical protein